MDDFLTLYCSCLVYIVDLSSIVSHYNFRELDKMGIVYKTTVDQELRFYKSKHGPSILG